MGKLRNLICSNRKAIVRDPTLLLDVSFLFTSWYFRGELQTRSCLIFLDTLVFKMEFGWGVGEDVASQTYNA